MNILFLTFRDNRKEKSSCRVQTRFSCFQAVSLLSLYISPFFIHYSYQEFSSNLEVTLYKMAPVKTQYLGPLGLIEFSILHIETTHTLKDLPNENSLKVLILLC